MGRCSLFNGKFLDTLKYKSGLGNVHFLIFHFQSDKVNGFPTK